MIWDLLVRDYKKNPIGNPPSYQEGFDLVMQELARRKEVKGMSEDYKIGDLVRLKSGGPVMTVAMVLPPQGKVTKAVEGEDLERVQCRWFTYEGEIRTVWFNQEILERVNEAAKPLWPRNRAFIGAEPESVEKESPDQPAYGSVVMGDPSEWRKSPHGN